MPKKNKILIWGPATSFSIPVAIAMAKSGWEVHFVGKSFLNLMTPLNLKAGLKTALKLNFLDEIKDENFDDCIKVVDSNSINSNNNYSAVIFCGLPPHFDEAKLPRAPWSIDEFCKLANLFKQIPVYFISSIWSAVQEEDGTVLEDIGYVKRKPETAFEAVCQSYENELVKRNKFANWYLIRIPLILGDSHNGKTTNFTGLYSLIHQMIILKNSHSDTMAHSVNGSLNLNYNPHACLNWLPVDVLTFLLVNYINDPIAPKICNLVPTQALLNEEWINTLAKAVGFSKAIKSDYDNLGIQPTLRKLLNENIQIKMRNLYEVIGRYKPNLSNLDENYYGNLITYANTKNWGNTTK